MEFVHYSQPEELENQFTVTYGPKGSGKTTFGLSMNPGQPLLMIDLDRRSYSARNTAIKGWGADIVEIPGLEVDPSNIRTMDEILNKRQEAVPKRSGKGTYDVWKLDRAAAIDVREMIREGLAHAASCPSSKVASVFVDDGKWLGTIWAAAASEDGRIGFDSDLDWNEVYGDLCSLLEPLTRTGGGTKDVLISHHTRDVYAKDPVTQRREKTGKSEPNWVDRIVKMADNVIEHYVNQQTNELGVKFAGGQFGKVPADNAGLYGRAIEGVDMLQYDILKELLMKRLVLE